MVMTTYEYLPTQHSQPVYVTASADRNNADSVPSNARKNRPVNGQEAP